mmetsp:Transcript_15810/g.33418  ORF Transcript_15810/g.33418 Transcript_15810/m.33418 type:complete len:244 (-) Transcript_15810:383-1114(-)
MHSAKLAVLDNVLLGELTGKSWDYFSVFNDSSISNINDLLIGANSPSDNVLLHTIHLYNMMIAFWRGNYEAAEESSSNALKVQPAARFPSLYLICHIFFRGLLSFQQYRENGGVGRDPRLVEGEKMMNVMEKWTLLCKDLFENKWLLLKAEYFASINEHDEAERSYIKSINASRDHGNIHELGLGYELLGKYYSSLGSAIYSTHCFEQAHLFYTQWGATALAEKILRDNPSLDMSEKKIRPNM